MGDMDSKRPISSLVVPRRERPDGGEVAGDGRGIEKYDSYGSGWACSSMICNADSRLRYPSSGVVDAMRTPSAHCTRLRPYLAEGYWTPSSMGVTRGWVP